MIKIDSVARYVSIVCVTLVATGLGLVAGNYVAEAYLRANPEILMTYEDRVNENTRAVREKMIPQDKITEWYALDSPEEVKPMWAEFYGAGAEFESYTHYRSRPLVGKYYGATEAGYRMTRDPGPWPIQEGNFNVFFFGGSTSFGVGPYWATVASYLQDAMNESGGVDRPVYVYNFGRSGYMSNQEQVLFHRLISAGHVPDMVVFLDGLNGFCWVDGNPSGWQSLQRFFNQTNEDYRRQFEGYGVVTRWDHAHKFIETLPLLRLVGAWARRTGEDEIPEYTKPAAAPAPEETPEDEATLRAIIDRYVNNIRQVEAVSKAYGIAPVFVWQPIPTYKYDLRHHLFNPDRLGCHVNSKAGYPIMAVRVAQDPPSENFLWVADMQEDLKGPLYIDAFHYTAPMSKRIAALIWEAIVDRRLVRADGRPRTYTADTDSRPRLPAR